jgi:hypothetical protein
MSALGQKRIAMVEKYGRLRRAYLLIRRLDMAGRAPTLLANVSPLRASAAEPPVARPATKTKENSPVARCIGNPRIIVENHHILRDKAIKGGVAPGIFGTAKTPYPAFVAVDVCFGSFTTCSYLSVVTPIE